MRKFYLKTTNGLLSTKRENTPGILFSVNYNQAIEFIESLPPTVKNKPLEICFEKNGMEFTNISRILRDPEIVKSSVNPKSYVICKIFFTNGYLQTDSTYMY